jgi:hypothetical protein
MDRYDIIAAITAKTNECSNKKLFVDNNDEESYVALYDGDTESEEGEMFRVLGFENVTYDNGGTICGVIVDDNLGGSWSLYELSDYELNLLWDEFFR